MKDRDTEQNRQSCWVCAGGGIRGTPICSRGIRGGIFVAHIEGDKDPRGAGSKFELHFYALYIRYQNSTG